MRPTVVPGSPHHHLGILQCWNNHNILYMTHWFRAGRNSSTKSTFYITAELIVKIPNIWLKLREDIYGHSIV